MPVVQFMGDGLRERRKREMKEASKVKKNVCFEILERILRTVKRYKDIEGKIVFIGRAKDWQAYYKDPNYQEELRRSKIFPDTEVAIFDQVNDTFCIVRKNELNPKYIFKYESQQERSHAKKKMS